MNLPARSTSRFRAMSLCVLASLLFAACGGGGDGADGGGASAASAGTGFESAQAVVSWAKVADEWRSFTTGAARLVRFGAGANWRERLVDGTGQCTSSFFGGDPAPNVFKTCEVQESGTAPDPAPPVTTPPATTWTRIAGEWSSFSIAGTAMVRFGAGSQWAMRTVSGTGQCSSAFFGGDPAPNVLKSCERASTGGGTTTPPAASTGTIRIAAGQLIEYYGDSTVYGNKPFVGTQVPRPAPKVFAEALGNRYLVANEGTSGKTSGDLLYGTDGRHPAWEQQMANSKAVVVIINHAINDKTRSNVVTYTANLRALASIARARGKQVVFETPNPDWWGGLGPFVDAMKLVAREQGLPVIDQYAYLTSYLNGADVRTLMPDNTHPSEFTYELKGKYAAKVFSELLVR